jgi:uncharacterized surface protein with fasciclin (FAS1) repeats
MSALEPPCNQALEIDDAEEEKLDVVADGLFQHEEDEVRPLPAVYGLPEDDQPISPVASLPLLHDEEDDDDDGEHQQPHSIQQLSYAIAAQAAALEADAHNPMDQTHPDYHFSLKRAASRPGAVAVGGGGEIAEASAHFDPVASGNSASHTVVAEIAAWVNEDEVRLRAHQEFLQTAVQADVVPERKCRNRYLPVGIAVLVLVIIVTTFLSVILTQHQSSSPHQQPTSSPQLLLGNNSPTQAPSTFPPGSSQSSDFSNSNSNRTILELLDLAQNHTMLADSFNRNGSSLIQDYLNTEVTLFAPTDDSFRSLSVPYSYYITSAAWDGHLVLLLAYHIVTEPLNRMLIFSASALSTWSSLYPRMINS